jgi:hypothetical protein
MLESPLPKMLGLCVPVSLRPVWISDYSKYTKISCPDCGGLMWIGERLSALQKTGECHTVCMLCGISKYGVRSELQVTSLANTTEH